MEEILILVGIFIVILCLQLCLYWYFTYQAENGRRGAEDDWKDI